ncbi:LPD7 domain-containing protein, partial [Pseudomonas syringae group genomosp. 3]|uniref:LPD7 domain-containing protein n=1 Tax=Pseudomonas syringae group genomosp. 3 TaxID=251701 RepID=UPI003AF31AE1
MYKRQDYHRGPIEVTGSEAFKSKTIALIARHQIEVTMRDPAQQALLDKARIDAAHEAADLEHERIVAAEMARHRV